MSAWHCQVLGTILGLSFYCIQTHLTYARDKYNNPILNHLSILTNLCVLSPPWVLAMPTLGFCVPPLGFRSIKKILQFYWTTLNSCVVLRIIAKFLVFYTTRKVPTANTQTFRKIKFLAFLLNMFLKVKSTKQLRSSTLTNGTFHINCWLWSAHDSRWSAHESRWSAHEMQEKGLECYKERFNLLHELFTRCTMYTFSSTAICKCSFCALERVGTPIIINIEYQRLRNLSFLAFESKRSKNIFIEGIFNANPNRRFQLC